VKPTGVIARQPHGLHHGLGARHVEGHLVEAGDCLQPRDIVGDHRVIGAEHRPERAAADLGAGDAVLVEVVTEDIDAVGAGQIVEDVAVHVGQRHAGRGLHEGAGTEIVAHQTAVLKGNAIALDELQVGDAFRHLRGHLQAFRKPLPAVLRETEERVAPLAGDLGRSAVGCEELLRVEIVERNQSCNAPRQLRVTGKRAMLGARQQQSRVEFEKGEGRKDGGRRKDENQQGLVHADER
jgi:hypothetical protein